MSKFYLIIIALVMLWTVCKAEVMPDTFTSADVIVTSAILYATIIIGDWE